MLLSNEHHFIGYLRENCFVVSFCILLRSVLMPPRHLFDACWTNQRAVRALSRVDRSFLRVELRTEQILGLRGPIFGALRGPFWGSKMSEIHVEVQRELVVAFKVEFGHTFGDLLVQHEHVSTVV